MACTELAIFFLLEFYFFPIRSVEMRKDSGCSVFLANILVAIFFPFLQQQEAGEKKEFHQGGGRRLKGRTREGMGH